jgi:Na+/H+ antiporter NhaD/arsenite permease-like protein
MISIVILLTVFVLIAVRQVGNFKLQIWQIMLGGAVVVLAVGEISFLDAFRSINFDVIIFLAGMFIVGEALERSGLLAYLSYNFFKNAKTVDSLLLFVLFGMGIVSVFLMNDTVAIIGTPVVFMLAKKNNLPVSLLLLALAFAITTGSVTSPIGNPQNLLIAVNGGLNNSFITFSKYLFIPTVINLFIIFFVLKFFFRNEIGMQIMNHEREKIKDQKLAFISGMSLLIIILLVALKIFFIFFHENINFRLTYISIGAALPLLLFSKNRFQIIKKIDWHTLIFFSAMFILMQSVWNSGYFQEFISKMEINASSIFLILLISILFSQLISNVPLVALMLPVLMHQGLSARELMALAAGSTIAGNMLILGAASNIIIIQNSEKKNGHTITFWQFARIGIPITVINMLVYYWYLKLF